MTSADKRMMELLDRWLTSLELHLKYAALTDADYFAVQPWPTHDRPTRWILELARQKTQELRTHLESRVAMGDSKFSESLELMGFLSNLVGSQHVERFIPLAEPDKEQEPSLRTPKPQSQSNSAAKANGHAKSVAPARDELDSTREMPRVAAPSKAPTELAPAGKPPAAAKLPPKTARKAPATPAPAAKAPASAAAVQKKVMADAVRLLKWGKDWHELVDLIARIADRPPAAEIRRILRSHKAEIEMQAEGDE